MVRLWLATGIASLALGAPPAVAAVTGSIQGTTLTITGDGADDTIAISPSADTTHLDVDTNGDAVADLSFDRNLFDHTAVDAGAGSDSVAVANATAVDGVSIDGGPGDDVLLGGDGGESIHGGEDNDVITGGRGNDVLHGDAGDDRFIWNPGDSSDTIEGDDGADVFAMNGANVNETVAVTSQGSSGRVLVTRDVAAISHDVANVESINLRLIGGADTYTGGNGLAGLVKSIQVDGGPGTDTLNGGDANETLIGGADGDTVNGGAGEDTFPVGINEGTEAVDGGSGDDVLAIAGTDASESYVVDAPAIGQPVVSRDLGGAASGTGIERVRLATLGGNDAVALTPGAVGAITVDLDGGDGDDILQGSAGSDTLRGGAGNDRLSGGDGNDTLFGDAGDDTLNGQGGADTFHCAGPTDILDTTAEDIVDADCLPAPVMLPPVTPQPDLTAPKVTITGLPKSISRGKLLKRGLSFKVQPNEAAALQADLLGRTRKAKLAAAGPNLVLASRILGLVDGARSIRFKPSKRLVGRAKRFTLTVRIVATDGNRNRSTTTRTVKVR